MALCTFRAADVSSATGTACAFRRLLRLVDGESVGGSRNGSRKISKEVMGIEAPRFNWMEETTHRNQEFSSGGRRGGSASKVFAVQ